LGDGEREIELLFRELVSATGSASPGSGVGSRTADSTVAAIVDVAAWARDHGTTLQIQAAVLWK
jgi:hypothetical protein